VKGIFTYRLRKYRDVCHTRLNRPVAIKFLSDKLADTAARRRFQREAQLASSLNHPHIVTVHDVGEFKGRQYLVTEYIDGGTLNDWATKEKRSWREVIELLIGVADALVTRGARVVGPAFTRADSIRFYALSTASCTAVPAQFTSAPAS
jgi:serine/threonine protein kinase